MKKLINMQSFHEKNHPPWEYLNIGFFANPLANYAKKRYRGLCRICIKIEQFQKKLKLLTSVNLNFPYSEFFLIRQMKTSSNLKFELMFVSIF